MPTDAKGHRAGGKATYGSKLKKKKKQKKAKQGEDNTRSQKAGQAEFCGTWKGISGRNGQDLGAAFNPTKVFICCCLL